MLNKSGYLLLCTWLTVTAGLYGQMPGGETKSLANDALIYRIDKPAGYNQDGQPVPLLLFLHGGDRSNTKHHPLRYARKAGIHFPFLVLAPHCPAGCSWNTIDIDRLLSEVVSGYNVDRNRIYITGYSYGAYGTWSLLSRSPEWFAAAAPIAGGGSTNQLCKLQNINIRAYHGTNDRVTAYANSKKLIDALRQCSTRAELVSLEGKGHGIWPEIFSQQEFYDWLLKHNKTTKPNH